MKYEIKIKYNIKMSKVSKDFKSFLCELKQSTIKEEKQGEQEKYNKNDILQPIIKYNNTFVIEYASNMNPNLDYTYLIKLLKQYGLKQSNNPNENHLFGIISPSFFSTKFYLLNNFQFVRSISDKFSLYFNLKLLFSNYYNQNYPESFLLTSEHTFSDLQNKVYISRPISAWSGKDIIIIDSEYQLKKAQKLLLESRYASGISLTEYVSNLVRFQGRKMHLRVYYCMTLINNVFNAYLLDAGGIYTAKKVYKNAEWDNTDIHDTHFGNTGVHLFFPEDLYNNTDPKISKIEWQIIYDNMKKNIEYVSMIALANVYKYTNSKNAWEVFGIDFFIRDDLSTFIIEINSKNVGYKATEKINKYYFDWINDIVIKPTLFPYIDIEQRPCTTSIITKTILEY